MTTQMHILYVAIAILGIIVLFLLCRLAFLKRKKYMPKVGEIYKGKIRVALNDKIYASHSAIEPLCSVKDTIHQSFKDPTLTICLSYEATSKSGRFLVYLDNNYCWVEPSSYKNNYKIQISRPTNQNQSKK